MAAQFGNFTLLPSILFTPAICYCNLCGQVILQSKQRMHNNAYSQDALHMPDQT